VNERKREEKIKEINAQRKIAEEKTRGLGMGNEGSWLFAFTFPQLPLFLPLFSLSKGFCMAKRERCTGS